MQSHLDRSERKLKQLGDLDGRQAVRVVHQQDRFVGVRQPGDLLLHTGAHLGLLDHG